jgi:hypothetical protein
MRTVNKNYRKAHKHNEARPGHAGIVDSLHVIFWRMVASLLGYRRFRFNKYQQDRI